MDSDNDARIGYGRRASSSSSRESSPAAKRQKRSFTPNSDDETLVVPAPIEDEDNADTPSRDGTPAPLIRQAVGFSWQPSVIPTATVNTYQAVLPSNTNAIQFLPGQAPLKKKKKRAKPEYSAQTGRFRLSRATEPTPAPTPEPLTQPALYAGGGPYSSMYRMSSAASPSASVTMSNASVADAASPAAEAHSPAASSTIASTTRNFYNATPGAYSNTTVGPRHSRAPGQVGGPATITKNKRSKKSTRQHTERDAGTLTQPSASSRQPQPPSTMHYPPHPGVQSHYRRDYERNLGSRSPSISAVSFQEPARPTSSAHERSAAPSASGAPMRPLRMLTLLIEDVRSGVPDHQLAEIKVVLRPGEESDGGFWANAKEVCETLQAGPSRIDGPARVYTLRGKYRQFFMRVDADNVLEAESCNLGVSKERTLEVVVEAPVPKGHLPPPPRVPRELQPTSSSDSDTALSPSRQQSSRQAMHSVVTRDTRIDLLSQSDYRPQKKKRPSQSHSSPRNKASRSSVQRTPSPSHTPRRAKRSRHGDQGNSSSSDEEDVREISPPIPGRHAETADERDDAIANFIRSDIESDKEWPRCMSIISHGGPKRVSDILWSYNYVENKVKEHEDRKTPSHWDGAPNSRVERRHVWRALNLTPEWGYECRTVVSLVSHYGKYGRRYQDPHVINEIESTAAPTEKTWKQFVRLLHSIDAQYLSGRLINM